GPATQMHSSLQNGFTPMDVVGVAGSYCARTGSTSPEGRIRAKNCNPVQNSGEKHCSRLNDWPSWRARAVASTARNRSAIRSGHKHMSAVTVGYMDKKS